jgi:2-haloacid dehalogenase
MKDLPLIVFDCNETLLNLDSMAPTFQRILADPSAMRSWFEQLITYSQALTISDIYVPFTDIGAAVLGMMATARGIQITDTDRTELTDKFATMPPHPEVPDALRRLKKTGFRLFTLTDNTAEISGRQITHAGLLDVFERRFSVDDEARRHKPAPEAYHAVTRALNVPPSKVCLVACHTWDTIGAVSVGWQAALIKRSGNDILDTLPQPQINGRDLNEVADCLIALHMNQG